MAVAVPSKLAQRFQAILDGGEHGVRGEAGRDEANDPQLMVATMGPVRPAPLYYTPLDYRAGMTLAPSAALIGLPVRLVEPPARE
jgi:hypothetical protein